MLANTAHYRNSLIGLETHYTHKQLHMINK